MLDTLPDLRIENLVDLGLHFPLLGHLQMLSLDLLEVENSLHFLSLYAKHFFHMNLHLQKPDYLHSYTSSLIRPKLGPVG